MVNHNIGSAEIQDVRAASRYMNEIEMLRHDRALAYAQELTLMTGHVMDSSRPES